MLKICVRYQNYEFALIYSGIESVKFCLTFMAYGYNICVNVFTLPAF